MSELLNPQGAVEKGFIRTRVERMVTALRSLGSSPKSGAYWYSLRDQEPDLSRELFDGERSNSISERSRVRVKVRDWLAGRLFSSAEDDGPDFPFDEPPMVVDGGHAAPLSKEDQATIEAGWDDLMNAFERSKNVPPIQD